MKPVDFAYQRPATLADAIAALAATDGGKLIAGGQTLGPMLNLRLVRPRSVIDISRIAALQEVVAARDELTIGACVTHAAIEDGRLPDVMRGFLQHVARGIAYRAVRNRGTLGGSLAHADPAADWLTALLALGAQVGIAGPSGQRRLPLSGFVTGAMTTTLGAEELIATVHIPSLSPDARWGYHKLCRKTGEFADAIGAVLIDPARSIRRAVAGATGSAPIVLDDVSDSLDRAGFAQRLDQAGYRAVAYDRQIHAVALERAFTQAGRR